MPIFDHYDIKLINLTILEVNGRKVVLDTDILDANSHLRLADYDGTVDIKGGGVNVKMNTAFFETLVQEINDGTLPHRPGPKKLRKYIISLTENKMKMKLKDNLMTIKQANDMKKAFKLLERANKIRSDYAKAFKDKKKR